MQKLDYGAVGTAIDTKVIDSDGVVDLSAATELWLILKRPNGTRVKKAAAIITDGKDGMVRYITQASDLDQIGTWTHRVQVVTPSGSWTSIDPQSFDVV